MWYRVCLKWHWKKEESCLWSYSKKYDSHINVEATISWDLEKWSLIIENRKGVWSRVPMFVWYEITLNKKKDNVSGHY